MVAITGALPVLIPLKDGILPIPLAPRPIDVVLFVQLNTIVPPGVGLVKVTAVVGLLSHTTWLATGFTVATGFTFNTALAVPVHPLPSVAVTE